MTRSLSAAGLAAYAIAVCTTFPSVNDALDGLAGVVPAAAAAEAGTQAAAAPVGTEAGAAGVAGVPATATVWDADRDGMLMEAATSHEPFSVLNPA